MFTEKTNRRKISDICYRLSFIELRGKNIIDLLATQKQRTFNVNERDVFKVSWNYKNPAIRFFRVLFVFLLNLPIASNFTLKNDVALRNNYFHNFPEFLYLSRTSNQYFALHMSQNRHGYNSRM